MKISTKIFLIEIDKVCEKHGKVIDVDQGDKLCVYSKDRNDDYLSYLLNCEDLSKGDE